jgi:hypothetical protein
VVLWVIMCGAVIYNGLELALSIGREHTNLVRVAQQARTLLNAGHHPLHKRVIALKTTVVEESQRCHRVILSHRTLHPSVLLFAVGMSHCSEYHQACQALLSMQVEEIVVWEFADQHCNLEKALAHESFVRAVGGRRSRPQDLARGFVSFVK